MILAGGINQPPRRIDLDQYDLVTATLRLVNCPGDVFLRDRLNGVIDNDLEDFGGGDGAKKKSSNEAEKDSRNGNAFH